MLKDKLKVSIKKARQEKGLTQAQLASMVGVSVNQVNKWENGKAYPELDRIEVLGGLLHKDPLWLLSLEDGGKDMVSIPRHYALILRDILTQKGMPVPTELTTFQPALADLIVCTTDSVEMSVAICNPEARLEYQSDVVTAYQSYENDLALVASLSL